MRSAGAAQVGRELTHRDSSSQLMTSGAVSSRAGSPDRLDSSSITSASSGLRYRWPSQRAAVAQSRRAGSPGLAVTPHYCAGRPSPAGAVVGQAGPAAPPGSSACTGAGPQVRTVRLG